MRLGAITPGSIRALSLYIGTKALTLTFVYFGRFAGVAWVVHE